MDYIDNCDYNKWRHLYTGETEMLRKYFDAQYKIGFVFFRIPQCVTVVVTIALVVSILVKWDDYVSDIPQLLMTLFLGLPFLWGIFFFGPKFLMKAMSREENAVLLSRALVSERQIISKCLAFEGASANRRQRKCYEFEVAIEGLERPTAFIHTTKDAYDRLNPGDTCYVLYCPRENDKKAFAVFMRAFLVEFEELQSAFGTK